MSLVLVELSRFRSRRAIALMLLGAALVTAALAGATIWGTRPVSTQEMARAQAQVQRETERPYVQREIRRCEKNPERFAGPRATAADCQRLVAPRLSWFLHRPALSLAQQRNDSGLAVLLLICAVMIIIGTTFAGADWSSGSMGNQLLFEPRRSKVWLAKGAATFLATLVASALLLSAFWLALYVTAEIRDISTGAAVQEEIWGMVGRGVLLAAFGALGGFALTMLVRHTVGTLAVMFAYAVGGEALTASLPIAGAGQWSLANNVFAWLRDGWKYYDESIVCPPGPGFCTQEALLTLTDGVLYVGVLVLVVVVFSVFFFHRRDIA